MAAPQVIIQLRHGPFWNFSYVVGVPGSEALVIDPAWDIPAIHAAASEHDMRITHVAVTHGHHDHAHGLTELVERTAATVFVHQAEAAMLAETFGGRVTAVEHDANVLLGPLRVRFLHTPGHTPGSMALYVGEHVFTGDTLTTAGRGRHGAYEGAAAQLDYSLTRVLAALAPGTAMYPGHDSGPSRSAVLGDVLARVRR
ncbi:MAG: MBL fold metallo-hydrolase [Dehalococcoidia bacterium]|nr:MBL fold metallo-hydrolase [Dehalococcoidia bacterium]